MRKSVLSVKSLIEHFNFNVVVGSKAAISKTIDTPFLTLIGTQISQKGHDETINQGVIITAQDCMYIDSLPLVKKKDFLKQIISVDVPFVILSKDAVWCVELLEIAKENDVTVVSDNKHPITLISELHNFIKEKLTPYTLLHGTLVEVFGSGVLIRGESGIGKSEISLELIKKGHRLVADDSVLAKTINQRVYGEAPKHLKNLLEVRGLGIIDVYRLFGVTAVSESCEINYIIDLVNLEEIRKENRLAENVINVDINGTIVPSVHLPVSSGRSMAGLVEVAVMDLRNRTLGYNSTKEFMEKYDKLIKEETDND